MSCVDAAVMVWDFPHYRGICGCLKSHAHFFFFHTALSQLRLFPNVLLHFYFFTPPPPPDAPFQCRDFINY